MGHIEIPQHMMALVLKKHIATSKDIVSCLSYEAAEIPLLEKNQVLIKVAAAACNPSDILMLENRYGIKKSIPFIPGIEGSGTVIKAGGSIYSKLLVGKRVAFAKTTPGAGSWGQYCATETTNCIPMSQNLSFPMASDFVVNPFTAISMLEITRDRIQSSTSKCVVQTAANSSVGRYFARLAQAKGFIPINIVRSDASAKILNELGIKNILNYECPNFAENFKDLCGKFLPRLIFDAYGGEIPVKLLALMPKHSELISYGSLTSEPLSNILAELLIFENKTISGFWLTEYLSRKNLVQIIKMSANAKKMILANHRSFPQSRIIKIENSIRAIQDYAENKTLGKFCIEVST